MEKVLVTGGAGYVGTDIRDACCAVWNVLANIPGKITRITEREWAQVTI